MSNYNQNEIMSIGGQIMNIFSNTDLIEKALDVAILRHQVISNNIANVDTPGFKKSVVKFEEFLNDEIKLRGYITDEKHMPIGNVVRDPEVEKIENTSMREDGNNVDIDVEMSLLAKNMIWYNALIEQITREFGQLRTAITEGRK